MPSLPQSRSVPLLSFLPQKQIDFFFFFAAAAAVPTVIMVPVSLSLSRLLVVAQKQRSKMRREDNGPIFSLCSHSRFRRLPFCLRVFGSVGLYPKIPIPSLLSLLPFKMKYCRRLWISERRQSPSLPLSTQNDKYAARSSSEKFPAAIRLTD